MKTKMNQNAKIRSLVEECIKGDTKRDFLPTATQTLQGEVEAMYFMNMRRFMENSVSHRIMNSFQDVYNGR